MVRQRESFHKSYRRERKIIQCGDHDVIKGNDRGVIHVSPFKRSLGACMHVCGSYDIGLSVIAGISFIILLLLFLTSEFFVLSEAFKFFWGVHYLHCKSSFTSFI